MRRISVGVSIIMVALVWGMTACSKDGGGATKIGITKTMTKDQVLNYAKTLTATNLAAKPAKSGDTVLTEWGFGTYDLGTVDKVNGEMVHFVWKDPFAKGEKDKEVHASKVHVYTKPKEGDLKPGVKVIVQKPGDYVDSMYVEGYVVDVLGPQQYKVFWKKGDETGVDDKSIDHIWFY